MPELVDGLVEELVHREASVEGQLWRVDPGVSVHGSRGQKPAFGSITCPQVGGLGPTITDLRMGPEVSVAVCGTSTEKTPLGL